jgi:GT2 family glycosyltransferase
VFSAVAGFRTSFRRAAGEDRDFAARCRAAGWPILYLPAAIVQHCHHMGLRGFLRQHYNYGRSARGCLASERRLADKAPRSGLHRALLLFCLRQWRVRGAVPVLLAVLSQAVVAAGYAREILAREDGGPEGQ